MLKNLAIILLIAVIAFMFFDPKSQRDKAITTQIDNYLELAKNTKKEVLEDTERRKWIADNATVFNSEIYGVVLYEMNGVYPWKSFPLYPESLMVLLDMPIQGLRNTNDLMSFLLAERKVTLTDKQTTFLERLGWYIDGDVDEWGSFIASQNISYEAVVYVYDDSVSHEVSDKTITVTIQTNPFNVKKDFRMDLAAMNYAGVNNYAGIPLNGVKPTLKEDLPKKFELDARESFELYIDNIKRQNTELYKRSLENYWKQLTVKFKDTFPGVVFDYRYRFVWK